MDIYYTHYLETAFYDWLRAHGLTPKAEYVFRLRSLLDEIVREGERNEPRNQD